MDPYLDWLGIPAAPRPPTHYELLNVAADAQDWQQIEANAAAQAKRVRRYSNGPHAALARRLLEEISDARGCLLDPQQRRAYDDELRKRPRRPVQQFPNPAAPAAPHSATAPGRGQHLPASSGINSEPSTLDFALDLPSQTRRGPGVAQRLAGWAGAIAMLLIVGGVGSFVAIKFVGEPVVQTRRNTESEPAADSSAATTTSRRDAAVPANSAPTTNPEPAATTNHAPPTGDNAKPTTQPIVKATAETLAGEIVNDRTLSAVRSPYRLQAAVTVRQGATLTIEPGTELIANAGSELVVHGRLFVSGTSDTPVRFHGVEPGFDAWKGIRCQGDFCEAQLFGLVVSDATTAVTLDGVPLVDRNKFKIDTCAFVRNGSGIRIEQFCSVRVVNTVVLFNQGDGVFARQDDGVYSRVTLAANGGKGYLCLGKPAAQFDSCTIIGNGKGGIHCGTAGQAFNGRWTISRCNLFGNGPFDVFCDQTAGVTVGEIYWGASNLRELRALGPNTKRTPRRRIWDGLHAKYRERGIVIVTSSANEPFSDVGAEPVVMSMAGAEPFDASKWDDANPRPGTKTVAQQAKPPELPALFADLASDLRKLLAERRYESAAELLEKASREPQRQEVRELISDAQEDVRLLQRFWELAEQNLSKLRPGAAASIGGIAGELVEFRDGHVKVRVRTVVRESLFSDLQASDLVPLVAGPDDPTNPTIIQSVWLFLTADPHASSSDVDHWVKLADNAGTDMKRRGQYLVPKGKAATVAPKSQ